MKVVVSLYVGNKVIVLFFVGLYVGSEYVYIIYNLYIFRKIKLKYCLRFYYLNCDKVFKKYRNWFILVIFCYVF